MAHLRYRIKLYGHTSDDPSTFLKNLARVLNTSVPEAKKIMQKVPVTLKEGLEKEKAQAFMETLKIIRGLAILEPMELSPTEQMQSDPALQAAMSLKRDLLNMQAETV